MAGRRDLGGTPWVLPHAVCGESDEMSLKDVAPLPRVLVWAPEKLLKGWRLPCPTCARNTSPAEFHAPRVVHTLNSHYLYVTTKHVCYHCSGSGRGLAPTQRTKISADRPTALACVPASLRQYWHIVTTGKALFDVEVLDHVRSMATRTSWSALADGINEMKCADWERRCLYTKGATQRLPNGLKVSDYLLRQLYLRDARERHEPASQGLAASNGIVFMTPQLESKNGSEIVSFDWTVDAARRCGSPYLFNAMCNNSQMVLLSVLTETSAPNEISSAVAELKQRGIHPKVAYVDDDCCGAWRSLLQGIWQRMAVRLDIMHAMRRLTRSVSSTQHPWHGEFCGSLSSAIYAFDVGEQRRLRTAWRRAGNICEVPRELEKRYVPRVVTDPARIASSIEGILTAYARRVHPDAGQLLTPATHRAWASLKVHVLAGCLCDPPVIQLNKYGDAWSVGGESFKEVTSTRGSSALEGFHAHQKQWLGPFATHGAEAGTALLRDGTARWNRNRRGSVDAAARMPT